MRIVRYAFRIRTELHGGAWCPKERVSRDAHEYLQIDLERLKVITLVETQGRFGNGQVHMLISQFYLRCTFTSYDTHNNNNNIHICIAPYGRKFQVDVIIMSTLRQSRHNKAGLKCPSVRPSVHKKFL